MSIAQPMSPDLQAVVTGVQLELGNWIELIDGPGAVYARRYAAWLLDGAPGSGTPQRPPELPAHMAAGIRELVLDEAHMRRRVPAHLGGGR
jgi:hypothetical protein